MPINPEFRPRRRRQYNLVNPVEEWGKQIMDNPSTDISTVVNHFDEPNVLDHLESKGFDLRQVRGARTDLRDRIRRQGIAPSSGESPINPMRANANVGGIRRVQSQSNLANLTPKSLNSDIPRISHDDMLNQVPEPPSERSTPRAGLSRTQSTNNMANYRGRELTNDDIHNITGHQFNTNVDDIPDEPIDSVDPQRMFAAMREREAGVQRDTEAVQRWEGVRNQGNQTRLTGVRGAGPGRFSKRQV